MAAQSSSQPANTDGPPAANTDRPPAADTDRPPAANRDRPPAANTERPPAANNDRPPAANDDNPPHLESCVQQEWEDNQLTLHNTCDQVVVVRYMTERRQTAVERRLKANDLYRTGLTKQQSNSIWWMYTACPVGTASSVPFVPANHDEIIASRYKCVSR